MMAWLAKGEHMEWISIALMWGVIIRGMRDSYLRARERRTQEAWDKSKLDASKRTGLSLLQIQIACDAAHAAFNQRLSELMESMDR